MAGQPTLYREEYVEKVVEFCAEGYSLTGFAGNIGVTSRTLRNWQGEHEAFRDACERAKAHRALWWEERARAVAMGEGSGSGQATMVIFGLMNHAPDDYKHKTQHEMTGKDGGPIAYEEHRAAAAKIVDDAFALGGKTEEG